MPRKDAIEIEGAIVEALSQRLYRVEFKNGHRFLAHVPGKPSGAAAPKVGEKVTVEMSPFDFSKGRILLNKKADL